MTGRTYRQYCILVNDKNAENAETNRILMKTLKKHSNLQKTLILTTTYSFIHSFIINQTAWPIKTTRKKHEKVT